MRFTAKLLAGVAFAAALAAGSQALALTPISVIPVQGVYDTPPTTATLANQGYSGLLGDDFTVNKSGLHVTSLGAFDSTLHGITTNIQVGLFDLTTNAYVTPLVSFQGALNPGGDAYVFQSIKPVDLINGDSYSIIGEGFNSTDKNYNTNTQSPTTNGASAIDFDNFGGALTNGDSRYGGTTPTSGDTIFPYASAFGAGSLTLAVPEPSTWALMLLGLGGLGAAFRIQRRKALSVVAS